MIATIDVKQQSALRRIWRYIGYAGGLLVPDAGHAFLSLQLPAHSACLLQLTPEP